MTISHLIRRSHAFVSCVSQHFLQFEIYTFDDFLLFADQSEHMSGKHSQLNSVVNTDHDWPGEQSQMRQTTYVSMLLLNRGEHMFQCYC